MEVDVPVAVTLDEIVEQRVKGWTDFHPEDYCHRCGRPNINWFVDSALWNEAIRIPDNSEIGYRIREGFPDSEITCPQCFVKTYEAETSTCVVWELKAVETGEQGN